MYTLDEFIWKNGPRGTNRTFIKQGSRHVEEQTNTVPARTHTRQTTGQMNGLMYFHRRTYIYHRARSETLVLSQKNTTFTTPRVNKLSWV